MLGKLFASMLLQLQFGNVSIVLLHNRSNHLLIRSPPKPFIVEINFHYLEQALHRKDSTNHQTEGGQINFSQS